MELQFKKIKDCKPENNRKCLIITTDYTIRSAVSEIDNGRMIWKYEYYNNHFAKEFDSWRYANDLEFWKHTNKALDFKYVFGALLKKKNQTINEWFDSLKEVPEEPVLSFGKTKASLALSKMLPDLSKQDRKFFTFTYEKMRSDLSTILFGNYHKFCADTRKSAKRIMQTIYHAARQKVYSHFMFNNIVESDPMQDKAERLFFAILRQEYSNSLKKFKSLDRSK